VVNSQGSTFETRGGCDSYKIDLEGRYCSCRLWELSGIPCVLACAAINYINATPEEYISDYFSKDKFLECYMSNILPRSNTWEETNFIKPLPPLSRRMPGRPAIKRRRRPSETESKFPTSRGHPTETESKFPTSRVQTSRTVRCKTVWSMVITRPVVKMKQDRQLQSHQQR